MAGYPMIGRQDPSGRLGGGGGVQPGVDLPPEVQQLIDRILSGGGGNPSGPQIGGANPDPSAVAKAALPTITPGGDIGQMVMEFLTAPGSPIGKLLNPDKGFGIVGPGGPGLPPPNLMGGLSGGGAPGTPPDPSQVRTNAVTAVPKAVYRTMRDPTRLGSDAMAGFGGGGGVPPGPGGAAMGNNADIANVIRAMTAVGGDDGVPADGNIVDPNRGRQAGAKAPLGKSYTGQKIKRGQTLSGIAGGDKDRMRMIQASNPSISDPNKIRAGDTINVPVQNVTRAKGKKAIGSKQDIQKRAVSQAKEQSGHDRARKKNKVQAKRQAGNMYGVKGR